MYKDVAKKINFHKERIRAEFIKKGTYPNSQMVQERLDAIDTSLALFVDSAILEGNSFDSTVYNESFIRIYKDLNILYELLYSTFVQEYLSLKAFADVHLDELEDTAQRYLLKAEQETNSTSLGNTILFKNSRFNITTSNNIIEVNLGNVALHKGSRVACFMDADNIEADSIVFGFEKGSVSLYSTPYNYNQDSVLIPGELSKKTYTSQINADQIVQGPVEISLGDSKASRDKQYLIFGGKNKILIKEFSNHVNQYITERPTPLNMLSVYNKAHIDFYVVGGNKISFRFNKKPISTNFSLSDYQVKDLKPIEHFFIECDEGFSFDFELDSGAVYAIKERGVVEGDKLYFSRAVDVRDFYVEEYTVGDTDQYSITAKIYNDDGAPVNVNSVTVKELLMIGDVIE